MAWGYVEGGMGRISFAIAEAARGGGRGARRRRAASPRSCPARASCSRAARSSAPGPSSPTPTRRSRSACSATPPEPAFAVTVGGWRTTSPVVKVNCGLSRLPRWTALPDAELAEPGAGVDRACRSTTPRPAFEDCTARHPVARLRRAVLPDRVRPDGGAARQAHDVGVRAVRAVRPRRGHLGRRGATRSAGGSSA